MRNLSPASERSSRLEILVITGVIMAIIALLLPAVQQPAREVNASSIASVASRGHSLQKHKSNVPRTFRM